MEKETVGEREPARVEGCVCREFAHHIASALGIRSEEAREHLRNARVEVLKAVRSVIDDRIEYLARAGSKGTKVPVE